MVLLSAYVFSLRFDATSRGVDAEDAHDQDAKLEEDEGRGRHDHHRPAGAKHVVQ